MSNSDNNVVLIPIVNDIIIQMYIYLFNQLTIINQIISYDDIISIISSNKLLCNNFNSMIKIMNKQFNSTYCMSIISLITYLHISINQKIYHDYFCNVLLETKEFDSLFFKKNFIIYSIHIINLYNKHNTIFSIGDSLNKYDVLFNCLINNCIQSIPFSDSICSINSISGKINIDSDKLQLFNIGFINIFNSYRPIIDLIKNNKSIVLIDYGCKGRLYITLLYFFNKLITDQIINFESMIYLKFYMITFNEDLEKDMVDAIQELETFFPTLYMIELIVILSDTLNMCLTNSEQTTNTRCIPQYGTNKWSNELNVDIYMNEKTKHNNYVLCNLGRIVMINHFKHIEVFMKIVLLLLNGLTFEFVENFIKNEDIIKLMMFDIYQTDYNEYNKILNECLKKYLSNLTLSQNLQLFINNITEMQINIETLVKYYVHEITEPTANARIIQFIDIIKNMQLPIFV